MGTNALDDLFDLMNAEQREDQQQENTLRYLAAIIDANANFFVYHLPTPQPKIQYTCRNVQLANLMYSTLGGYLSATKTGRHSWLLISSGICQSLGALLPYMKFRHDQAQILYDIACERNKYPGGQVDNVGLKKMNALSRQFEKLKESQ